MDRSGWIDAKTHRRDGACSASVSSDSSASEVLVLISIAQTSPSQLQAQNSSKNIICWRGDLRPKSPLFPSATLHCSSLSLFVSLPVVSNPGKYLRNQLGCKINWMTIQEPSRSAKWTSRHLGGSSWNRPQRPNPGHLRDCWGCLGRFLGRLGHRTTAIVSTRGVRKSLEFRPGAPRDFSQVDRNARE